jgi:hypothetical protein
VVLFQLQSGIMLVVMLLMFAVKAWAFVDALTQRAEVYPAADKQTKQMWLIILGIALAAQMLIWSPLSFLNLIGVVAALVYLLDVRPAIRSLTRR